MFADTHCHLDFDQFSGRIDALMVQCDQSGLEMIVVPAVSASNWLGVKSICDQNERLCYALGLHPYFIESHQYSDLDALEQNLSASLADDATGLVALGEIGLDATRPDIDKQLILLDRQLALAEKYKLPVILHVRKLHSELLSILRKYVLVGGVVHAYSGSYELMMRYIDIGFMIGVGPVITWENSHKTRSAIAKAPLSSLLLETDSPDMFVAGSDKSKASPIEVVDVFNVLSSIRAESKTVLMSEIWLNSLRLFKPQSTGLLKI